MALSGAAAFFGLTVTSCAASQPAGNEPKSSGGTVLQPSTVTADLSLSKSFGRPLKIADGEDDYLIPAMVDAVNGDYVLAYRAGSAHAFAYGSDAGKLYVRRSADGGVTFGSPTLIASFVAGKIDIRDPFLYREPGESRIWLTFFTGARSLNGATWITYSDDDGVTWAPCHEILASALTPGGLRRSADGLWRMPVYRKVAGYWRASLVTAASPLGPWSVPVDVLAPRRSDATEWDFAEVSPTNWVAVVRGSARTNAFVTQSKDRGRTWAAPVQLPSPSPGLRYDAWPALRIAHNGRVLCFIRGAGGGQRLVQLFDPSKPLVQSNWSEQDGGGLLESSLRGTCGKFQPFLRGTTWVGAYYAETNGKLAAEIGIGKYDESNLRPRSSGNVAAAAPPKKPEG
ncbi:sialidase family protein [Sinomonas terrae]|uniref:Glycoside hydrolase n=1 Tax=Sinomonas terrae TaxID=2908838 RepID=A0ABS9TZ70_9MICC|nr:sialidase family protein [Sinomonas terrae]MCH6469665.1 glycoside hydrolase [Sinomonas terrae]